MKELHSTLGKRMSRYFRLVIALLLLAKTDLSLAELPTAKPETVGMRSERLQQIRSLVEEGIKEDRMPGCVVLVGRKGKVIYHEAFGHRQIEPSKVPMEKNTVFDMASITKPVATATSVMCLLELGKIRLREKVSTYVPEFSGGGKEDAKVIHLLTHQAGFVPDNALSDYRAGRERAFKNIYNLTAMYPPTERFVYSDVGFILLDDLIERQSGIDVHRFSKKYIFEPLGMNETGYLPREELRVRAAVTEQRDAGWMQGEVHDPRAYEMGGVAGHAGLFSTASDLAIYSQMMLQGGIYRGSRILSDATVELMTKSYSISEGKKVSKRGLGWDKSSGYSSNRAENMSERAFGHGGFTGTVLWIDPKYDLFFIFLSNRVHPNGKGSVNHLAGRIATVVVGAIDDELESKASSVPSGEVRTGIDLIQSQDYELLNGQRIGLITNQTGINRSGVSSIKLLSDAPNVKLAALFSPEHGLAGKLDQSIIGDSVDDGTGTKVFSLYGKTRKPSKQQLEVVDTLVFDVQDIGCRFYTYISTMGLAMQAAAENGKRFVVLDRPNPIGGDRFGGPGLDAGLESFVAFHDMPVQHGMTVGELAKLFQSELSLDELDLVVVPCEGWHRDKYFDETGLIWVNPSPNMRNLNQAILYPAIGLWETTNLSVGRGTDTPFEVLGAPWIDCQEFSEQLNAAGIHGVRFTPRNFTPTSSKFAGEECGGVQISFVDRKSFDTTQCGISIATVLNHLYPDKWDSEKAMRLLCHQATLDAIKNGHEAKEIVERLRSASLDEFSQRREQHLLY